MTENNLPHVGRAERVDFPKLGLKAVPAKIDTGADLSAIWASKINEHNGTLTFVLFAEQSPLYTGEMLEFQSNEYTITRVANSFGHREIRYRVQLSIKIQGKLIKGTFTLADRSAKLYPVLIGRRLLHNKFTVDVSRGDPLIKEENAKKRKLQQDLKELSNP